MSATLAFARVDMQLIKWNGSVWALDATFAEAPRSAMPWVSPQGTAWVLGASTVRRFTGGAWSSVPLPTGVLLGNDITGSSDSKVTVAAIWPGVASGTCEWNGSSWACTRASPGLFYGQRLVNTGTREWVVRDDSDYNGSYTTGVLRR